MAKTDRHIVQKQIFNLTLRKSKDSAAIQQRVSTICKNQLTPLLDELFSRLVKDDELLRIDTLEIDIGSVSPDDLERVLTQKIVKALEEKIQELAATLDPEIRRGPLNLSHFEAWIDFLKKGTLPFQLEGMEESIIQRSVLESLASHPSSKQLFRTTLLNHPITLERLVKQSEEAFLFSLLKACFGSKQAPVIRLRKALQEMLLNLPSITQQFLFAEKVLSPRGFFIRFWKEVFYLSLSENRPSKEAKIISHILKSSAKKKVIVAELIDNTMTNEGQQKPLERLKLALSIIEQDHIEKAKSKNEKPVSGEEKSLPKEQQQQEPGKEIKGHPLLEEEAQAKEIKSETESFEETDSPTEASKNIQPTSEEYGEKQSLKDKDLTRQEPDSSIPEKEGPGKDTAEKKHDPEEPPETSIPEDSKITKPEDLKIADETKEDELTLSPSKESAPKNEEAEQNLPYPEARGPDEKESRPEATTDDSYSREDLPEGSHYYIQHAGVILLHPFLKTYFDKAGLLSEDQFKDMASGEKAVHLLHYLSGGKATPPEYDLVLPKFLCGLPLNFPIERMINISEAEKKEGNHMLQAIIDHWGALGHVMPDSLQQGFLQREGKLEIRSGGWFLTIEKKTIDILLDKLPWGIGLIKLPWMPELLHVEWI